jgi:AcrR family transcriptional regulator
MPRPQPVKIGARATKQERSAERRQRIVDATIAIIAEHGIARITHRLVAARADLSLAATTYYYETKADIVADASAQLLASYIDAFRAFANRRESRELTFHQFVARVVTNAVGKHRVGTLAWCEIIVDAARHPEMRTIARTWFSNLSQVWSEIAVTLRAERPEKMVQSAIDLVIGLLLVVVPLGLGEAQVQRVLTGESAPEDEWAPVREAGAEPEGAEPRLGPKAEKTRQRILAAALSILVEEGPAAITYRYVAVRAGLTPTAPFYYFPTVEALLDAAQALLFEETKARYRRVMSNVDFATLDAERLIDLTTTIFQREATQYGAVSLATYPVWLEAARNRRLRPMVWAMVADQNRAWKRLLDRFPSRHERYDPLVLQCLFMGKLVRILSTGAATADLASVRSELSRDIGMIFLGSESERGGWYI